MTGSNRRSSRRLESTQRVSALAFGATLLSAIAAQPALAACSITYSSCYPWRIEPGQSETVLLEVIPNNTITSATYRVCLCPPTKSVALVFDFRERVLTFGTIPSADNNPVCRDFRVQTARSSRLMLRRSESGSEPVEGCYTTY